MTAVLAVSVTAFARASWQLRPSAVGMKLRSNVVPSGVAAAVLSETTMQLLTLPPMFLKTSGRPPLVPGGRFTARGLKGSICGAWAR